MKIYQNVTELAGGTPLLALHRFSEKRGLKTPLVAKVEGVNPAGSVKDRVAIAMLEDAEARGVLKKGGTIVEPTSGNTGIGLACAAAAKGYRLILTMPETMSAERRAILKAYGAELVLTEGAKGMKGAIAKADEIAATLPGSFLAGQFVNPANPRAHYLTTGPEIWADTEGSVAAFVAGVGTGGTISGVGKYLKEHNASVKIFAVEPSDSPVLSEGKSGAHKLQGIGAGFVPETLDRSVIDEVLTETAQEAYAAARALVREEGVLAGISAGAALDAAAKVAARPEFAGKTVVVLLPDLGDRYLSVAGLYD